MLHFFQGTWMNNSLFSQIASYVLPLYLSAFWLNLFFFSFFFCCPKCIIGVQWGKLVEYFSHDHLVVILCCPNANKIWRGTNCGSINRCYKPKSDWHCQPKLFPTTVVLPRIDPWTFCTRSQKHTRGVPKELSAPTDKIGKTIRKQRNEKSKATFELFPVNKYGLLLCEGSYFSSNPTNTHR